MLIATNFRVSKGEKDCYPSITLEGCIRLNLQVDLSALGERKLRVKNKNNKKREQEEEELGCEEEAVGARVRCRGVHRWGSSAAVAARRCAAPSLRARLLFSPCEMPFLCVLFFPPCET
jgi:hypothetical protein